MLPVRFRRINCLRAWIITGVENGNTTIPSSLRFAPALAAGESARLSGSTYEIRALPTYRLAAVTAWTTPRATL
jgi:hypothetical protein